MCGITGIWARDKNIEGLEDDLMSAVGVLNHRGPDSQGRWKNGNGVGLGHARLAILDLSNVANQPMESRDGRFVIVFNGEIYNYRKVRLELESRGYSFSGSGDTEVVLAAFQEWGCDAIAKFIGMFAIAVWDGVAHKLYLIRDRVGVKPLYYGWDGETLAFGSELKALRAYRHWRPEIDLQATGEFLQYGYISAPRTIYSNMKKLLPGHVLELGRTGEPIVRCYWSVLDTLDRKIAKDDNEVEEELESLLQESCQYRMVSDVPVGVYLSGGIDSSMVAAMLARSNQHTLKTFTIGFNEEGFDESMWAKKVADHLGTEHTEYKLETEEALDIARGWGDLFDEPFGDASGIPTFLVSRLASQSVKVVLSADGGDELFSGYGAYSYVLDRSEKLRRIPSWIKNLGGATAGLLPVDAIRQMLGVMPISASRRGWIIRRIMRSKAMLPNESASQNYNVVLSYWMPEDIKKLLGVYQQPRGQMDGFPGSAAEQMCLWDFHNYLPEDILTKVDRTTMAVSIEGREPLLDHRLVEYAFGLPLHLRRGTLGPKHILRKILYKYVPQEYVDRPKQGFGVPLDRWLRSRLEDLVRDHLNASRFIQSGIFNRDVVSRLISDFYKGNDHVASHLWYMLAFAMWYEKWG